MNQHHSLAPEALKQLFTEARTHHHWSSQPVSNETLQALYDLTKWGPTAVNANPLRIVFVKSDEAKAKLIPHLMGSNVDQVKQAPVTAIIAHDERFFDHLPTLFPVADMKPYFENDKAAADVLALRNGSLQGAYFMIAARALGLDVGPMSGFNNAGVDEAFLSGTSWKSNFLVNVGYGDASKVYPRGPRLDFETVAKII